MPATTYITEHRFAETISALHFGHDINGCKTVISMYLCVRVFCTLFNDDNTHTLVCVA
jgi:hypothetical protein